ncbi:MAG: hypothetical protein ACQEWU_03535 [Bacillota bacterium]|uniref:hypothetical protein n=1 Tax=Virgibacillus TaxID=84406 RepID=UPI0013CE6F9B|nr:MULTISPECIES: hypothetical protein [unclassified Virgibacillus]MDY7045578.1 hypothetical protein [Virgibacillus sp. M23]
MEIYIGWLLAVIVTILTIVVIIQGIRSRIHDKYKKLSELEERIKKLEKDNN